MASPQKFNMRNPSVKRIMQEIKEMQADTSDEYVAEALEEDIFEWHFAIRGPKGTDFEGGIYHGRITLPPEYPFKPPSFIMLTPSGRFETNTKICLSISSHHPEHWQPSWSVRTALTALVSFLPTPGNGALGSLDLSPQDRRELAAESVTKVPVIANNPTRTQVIASLHERLLRKAQQAGEAGEAGEADAADDKATEAVDHAPPAAMQQAAATAATPTAAPLLQRQPPQSSEERALTLLAGALVAIIVAILLRKCVAGLDMLTSHESSPI